MMENFKGNTKQNKILEKHTNHNEAFFQAIENKKKELEQARDKAGEVPDELNELFDEHKKWVSKEQMIAQQLQKYEMYEQASENPTLPQYIELQELHKKVNTIIKDIEDSLQNDWDLDERKAALEKAEDEYEEYVKLNSFRKNDPDGYFSAN